MKNVITILYTILFFAITTYTQERKILHSSGKKFNNEGELYNREVQHIDRKSVKDYYSSNNIITDLEKILFYEFPPRGNADFGFFEGDWMCQWFNAPGDMIIRRAGFCCSSVEQEGLTISGFLLVKVNWTKEELLNAGIHNWGYYEAEDNSYNNITAFEGNWDRTGDWVDTQGSGQEPIFGEDIWRESGFKLAPVEPIPSPTPNNWQWIDMNLMGFEPEISSGEIVGFAVLNPNYWPENNRIGIYANNNLGIPGFKFYANGRLIPGGPGVGDCGWWSREFTWDFALDVTLTGDVPPMIENWTELKTTYSTEVQVVSAKITDLNPSGGPSGVAEAYVFYSVNYEDYIAVPMTAEGEIYTAIIPGMDRGTEISYYYEATDIEGLTSRIPQVDINYFIFNPYREYLIVINGEDDSGYPTDYQMGADFHECHLMNFDLWAYGQVTPELLDNYEIIFEITLGGPESYGNDPKVSAGTGGEEYYREWLNAKWNRGLVIFGMDYLGKWNGYKDIDFVEGDFAYDILGISQSYNNVGYDGVSDQDLASEVTLIEGHPINTTIINAGFGPTGLSYDPAFEVGYKNSIDGFEIVSKSATVLMTTTTRGIGGSPAVEELPCAVHNVTANGNDVFFGSFNPLSIQYDPDGDNGINYRWVGFMNEFYITEIARYFEIYPCIVPGISDTDIPTNFSLSQNYPNPFNPSTSIKYEIPGQARNDNTFVTLKVYDMLGQEVTTLVNKAQSPGTHKVTFNAKDMVSGVYFYQLKYGSYIDTKKMLLLR